MVSLALLRELGWLEEIKVSTLFGVAIKATLILAAFYSFGEFRKYHAIDFRVVFDLCVILFVLGALFSHKCIRRMHLMAVLMFSVAFLFLLLLATLNRVSILDALLAYKWLAFLGILFFCSSRVSIQPNTLKAIVISMHLLFFFKYCLGHLLQLNHRPFLFTENNFEIPFLLILTIAYIVRCRISQHGRRILLSSAAIITAISMSTSGFIALVMMFIAIFSSRRRLFLFFAGTIPILIFGYYLIAERYSFSLAKIDRVRFFSYFLKEVEGFTVWEMIFGRIPLNPLSLEVCSQFKQGIHSFGEPYTCFSVVFHSFLLRLFHDTGAASLVAVFASLLYVLRIGLVPIRFSLAVLGVVFANSLSVSGLANSGLVLGILFLVSNVDQEASNNSGILPRELRTYGLHEQKQ